MPREIYDEAVGVLRNGPNSTVTSSSSEAGAPLVETETGKVAVTFAGVPDQKDRVLLNVTEGGDYRLFVTDDVLIPASSAMQLSRSFRGTVTLSVILGVAAVVAGLMISSLYDMAAGGAIVLFSIAIFRLCMLFKKIVEREEVPEAERAPRHDLITIEGGEGTG